MSSYRAELGGLIAILYTIYRICSHYQVKSGKLKYHCDNKGVIKNVFTNQPPTISQFLATDYDLIATAKRLLTLIPATIVTEWVKGHYTGDFREHKHNLNDKADKLAATFNKHPHPSYVQKTMPCSLPNYAIRLIHDGSTITTKLYHTMSVALHRNNLVTYLKKKHGWSDATFNTIHWDAHELAFKRQPRHTQIMVAKLIHKLVNTNQQNHRFYGKSPLCPCCQQYVETVSHVLLCSSLGSTETRSTHLKVLQTDLKSINTPKEVIDALIHGIKMWETTPTNSNVNVRALTVGSLRAPDVLLTAAFTDQWASIGWDHCFMGRLSHRWGAAVALYHKVPCDSTLQLTWTAQTIHFLWKYTRAIWAYRNTVVHGATDQEMADKIRNAATTKVTSLYSTFYTTPHFILPRHRYLFTSKTLEQRLRLDTDSLNCWLRSVEDATQALIHHENQQRLQATHFFAPFLEAGRRRITTAADSYDSTFSPPSHTSVDSTTTSYTSSTITTTSTSTNTSYTSNMSSTSSSQSIENSVSSNDPPSIISWSIS